MIDAKIIAACAASRKAYERVAQHIGDKDLSPQGQFWWKYVQDWYKRDKDATAVDLELLAADGERGIGNPKHKDSLLSYLKDLPDTPSAYNVAQEVLELKRRNAELEYAAAVVGAEPWDKRSKLFAAVTEWMAATELAEKQVQLMNDDEEMFALTARKNRIPVAPKKLTDKIDGGAVPGDHIVLFGRPECLVASTALKVRTSPNSTACKHLTIEQFHSRFNGKHGNRGGGPYLIQSVDASGAVYYNEVTAVIYSGRKMVRTYVLRSGKSITCTGKHRVLTPAGYVPAGNLARGDYIMSLGGATGKKIIRKEICTKLPHSPYERRRINGSWYNRTTAHRLAFDAYQNGYTVDEFIVRLKSGGTDCLRFSPSGMDIHHVDGNPENNSEDNLLLCTRAQHSAIHAAAGDCGNSHRAVADEIVSITRSGEQECYDISMAAPDHNFCAQGVFVHNSGKSLMAVNMAAGFLRNGHKVLYFGNEENAYKTRRRIVCNLARIRDANLDSSREGALIEARKRGFDLLTVAQGEPGSPPQINELIEEYKPTAVIIDQIRNLEAFGQEKSSLTHKLERLAIEVRNILSRHRVIGISVSQAGDKTERHGQEPPAWLTMADVDSSRTGLPAQADLLLGIGADADMRARNERAISICKNKLSHTHDGFLIEVDLERSIVR